MFENDDEGRDNGLNMKAWCAACGHYARVCCGDNTNGFYCLDCCEHPYEEREPWNHDTGCEDLTDDELWSLEAFL
jgi:hypothetical protein